MKRSSFSFRQKKLSAVIIAGLVVVSTLGILVKILPHSELKILYNQVGYIPEAPKVFLVEIPPEMAGLPGTFTIYGPTPPGTLQDGDFKSLPKVMNQVPLSFLGELWNRTYAQGNFSALVTLGHYTLLVQVGDAFETHVPIFISPTAYDLVMQRAVQFYYYQRCGAKVEEIVPGYVGHNLCHADDGVWEGEGTSRVWRNLSGGWHDAGDYGKYMEDSTNTPFSVYVLNFAYQANRDYWMNRVSSLYDSAAPDVVDEAIWGAQFLQKMVTLDDYDTPQVYCGIFGKRPNSDWNRFGYWGEPAGETDNKPSTGDERTVGSLWNVSGMVEYQDHPNGPNYINSSETMFVAAALASTAVSASDYSNWDTCTHAPSNLIANATALYNAHIGQFLAGGQIKGPLPFWQVWEPLLCATALGRWANVTGNSADYAKYVSNGTALHDSLFNASAGCENCAIPKDTNAQWMVPHLALWAAWQFENLVNGSASPVLSEYAGSWANKSFLTACNATGNFFQFCKDWAMYFGYYGTNWVISSAAATGLIAWNVTRGGKLGGWTADPDDWMRTYAWNNVVEWIMGRNPLDICQIESLGTHNLPLYSHRYVSIPGNPRGAQPGTVPNGIARAPSSPEVMNHYSSDVDAIFAAPDLPWFDLRLPNPEKHELSHFRSNEPYISDNAGFLWGFATAFQQLGL